MVGIGHISRNGICLYARGREFLLPFSGFPWFKSVKVSAVYNVERLHRTRLCRPDLDGDLDIDSLEHPEKYPLMAERHV
jgi:hypothetical protein